MRSLDRRSMYSIFAPLDPAERLPRELLLEQRSRLPWGILLGRQHVAGVLWIPAFLTTLALFAWLGNPVAGFAVAGLLLAGFALVAFRRRR